MNYKPENTSTVSPYLMVTDPKAVGNFLMQVFDAIEVEMMQNEDGTIRHSEYKIGDTVIMLGGVSEEKKNNSMLYIHVPDTEATYQKALEHGAISMKEPSKEFWGAMNAGVSGPCGNAYWIATQVEHLSEEEMQKRFEKQA